jgi:hypothetical protein
VSGDTVGARGVSGETVGARGVSDFNSGVFIGVTAPFSSSSDPSELFFATCVIFLGERTRVSGVLGSSLITVSSLLRFNVDVSMMLSAMVSVAAAFSD